MVRDGYKQTAIGLIPEDWDIRAVGDICNCIVPGRNKPKIFKGDIPWITTPDLEDGRSVSESKLGLFVSRDEAKSVGSKIVPVGAVLMSCVGELGIVSFVKREIVINQQLHAFIPTPVVEPFFLLNALQAQKDYMLSIATLTAVPYLNKDNCNSIPIPLPPLSEQRTIAQALSDVDALIAALDKLIVKKRNLKTATMQQLLTGKKRLPGFGEGRGYKESVIGLIPEDWDVRQIGEIADIDPENLTWKTHTEYEFKYISLEDVERGVLKGYSNQVFSTAPSRARRVLRDGDVLLSTVRPNLKSHLLFNKQENDWVCSTGFSVLRCKKGLSIPEFLFSHLFSGNIDSQIETLIAGSNYPAINSSDVRKLEISVSAVEEQRAIATVLSDMDAEIAALETGV